MSQSVSSAGRPPASAVVTLFCENYQAADGARSIKQRQDTDRGDERRQQGDRRDRQRQERHRGRQRLHQGELAINVSDLRIAVSEIFVVA